ncbi:MAG TPA: aminopeptidase, partial [Solirubrobacteraceae bacterium]|nr:aminopeptidase [Solirubrobacteraceae bacterium]
MSDPAPPPADGGLDPASFARLLVGYCLEVDRGQQVVVRSTSLAAPLLLEVQREILAREAWPLLRVELPGQTRAFYAHAADAHLDGYAPLAMEEARRADASLAIQAPENTRALAGIDP